MLALTLDTAENIAIMAVTALVIGAIAAAWLMKTIVQKLMAVAILGLFAFAGFAASSQPRDPGRALLFA